MKRILVNSTFPRVHFSTVVVCLLTFLVIFVLCSMDGRATSKSTRTSTRRPATLTKIPKAKLKRKHFAAVFDLRKTLNESMINYDFTEVSKSRSQSNITMADLVMDQGGKPVRSLIISTWKSGSSFMSGLLESHPGMFYEFEPFLHMGDIRFKPGPLADYATQLLETLLLCNYTQISDQELFLRRLELRQHHNPPIAKLCGTNSNNRGKKMQAESCKDLALLESLCRLYPFLGMKTVRLNLRFVEAILDNKELDVRVLLLIRDPRGIMQSRLDSWWCMKSKDCGSTQCVCEDQVDDYKYAAIFRENYPGRFLVLRYEDIMLNLEAAVRKMFKLFRLQYHSKVQQYIDKSFPKRSTMNQRLRFGYVNDNKHSSPEVAAFKWMQTVPPSPRRGFSRTGSSSPSGGFSFILQVQNNCTDAMKLWGYRKLENETELLKAKPIVSPPWPEMII